MIALPPDFTLRAPWPDELPRLRGLFHTRRMNGVSHLRALVREQPERIVGGFIVTLPSVPDGPGALRLRLRMAYHDSPVHEALLAAALTVARTEAGLAALTVTVAPEEPAHGYYLARGASLAQTDRSYEGDLLVAQQRLHAATDRASSPKNGYVVRPLEDADRQAVADLAAAPGSPPRGGALVEAALRPGPDAGLSFVCMVADIPVGALFARPGPRGQIRVERCLVHPEHRASSEPIRRLLLASACVRWLEAGFTTFGLGCQPDQDVEMVNLADELGCRVIRELHTLRWTW